MYRKKKSESNRDNWRFCSRKCFAIYHNKKRRLPESIKICRYCGKEFLARTKREKRKRFCSVVCSVVARNKTEKQKKSVPRGKNHYAWNGKSLLKPQLTAEWRKWRKMVYERDNYTCQHCGNVGGKLSPHHLKPVALYPKLMFVVDNGITLCRDCHKKTDTFGLKMVWKKRQMAIQ